VSASSRTGWPFCAAAIGAASGYCPVPGPVGASGSVPLSAAASFALPTVVVVTHLPLAATAPVSERGAALVTSCAASCAKLAMLTVILKKKHRLLSVFASEFRPLTCRARTTL